MKTQSNVIEVHATNLRSLLFLSNVTTIDEELDGSALILFNHLSEGEVAQYKPRESYEEIKEMLGVGIPEPRPANSSMIELLSDAEIASIQERYKGRNDLSKGQLHFIKAVNEEEIRRNF